MRRCTRLTSSRSASSSRAPPSLLWQVYSLYIDVITTVGEWKDYHWSDVPNELAAMSAKVDEFQAKCKKMPKALREYDAASPSALLPPLPALLLAPSPPQ